MNLFERFYMQYGNISPRNCFKGGRETNCRLNQLIFGAVKKGHTIQLIALTCDDQDAFESALIRQLSPPWNLAK